MLVWTGLNSVQTRTEPMLSQQNQNWTEPLLGFKVWQKDTVNWTEPNLANTRPYHHRLLSLAATWLLAWNLAHYFMLILGQKQLMPWFGPQNLLEWISPQFQAQVGYRIMYSHDGGTLIYGLQVLAQCQWWQPSTLTHCFASLTLTTSWTLILIVLFQVLSSYLLGVLVLKGPIHCLHPPPRLNMLHPWRLPKERSGSDNSCVISHRTCLNQPPMCLITNYWRILSITTTQNTFDMCHHFIRECVAWYSIVLKYVHLLHR